MKFSKLLLILCVCVCACTACMKIEQNFNKKKSKPKKEDPFGGKEFPDPAKTALTVKKASTLAEGNGWTKTTSRDGKNYPGETVYKAKSGSHELWLKLMKKDGDTSDKLKLAKFEILGSSIILNSAEQIDVQIRKVLDGLDPGFLKALDKAMSGYQKITQPGAPRNRGIATASNRWKCVVINYTPEPSKGVTAVITVERPFDPFE